jgi:hypothetical protein
MISPFWLIVFVFIAFGAIEAGRDVRRWMKAGRRIHLPGLLRPIAVVELLILILLITAFIYFGQPFGTTEWIALAVGTILGLVRIIIRASVKTIHRAERE